MISLSVWFGDYYKVGIIVMRMNLQVDQFLLIGKCQQKRENCSPAKCSKLRELSQASGWCTCTCIFCMSLLVYPCKIIIMPRCACANNAYCNWPVCVCLSSLFLLSRNVNSIEAKEAFASSLFGKGQG